MAQSLDRLKESPSQTAGPYVHIGLTPNFCGIGGVYASDLGSTMESTPYCFFINGLMKRHPIVVS